MFDLVLFAVAIFGACISPGSSLAMVMSQVLSGSRTAAIRVSLGIALCFWLQALFCLWGVEWMMDRWPHAVGVIRIMGALYLFYLGIQTLKQSRMAFRMGTLMPTKNPLLSGFVVTMLNPQAILFLVSLFQQFIQENMSLGMRLTYVATTGLCCMIWYSLVSWILTHPRLFSHFKRLQRPLLTGIGFFLLFLAGLMFYTTMQEGFV